MAVSDETATRVEADIAGELDIFVMPGHLIRRMHQVSQAVFDAEVAAAGFDLTSVQFAALRVIAARPGLDQATLAGSIAFDRATTGGVIDRLETKGLVRREVSKVDRRARHLYPSARGCEVLDGVRPAVLKAQDAMLVGLSAAERATLLRLLAKALSAAGIERA